jgi:Icc-related predicted phosphoesterase
LKAIARQAALEFANYIGARLEGMRILAGADSHGNLDVVSWFVDAARSRQVETIVLAGDLLGFTDEVEDPEEDQAIEGYLDSRTVLVTHSPAHGILDSGAGPHKIGSRALRALLDKRPVRAHIHGHSHSGFGRDGNHFNVASAYSKRAMLIDLESLEHEVLTD